VLDDYCAAFLDLEGVPSLFFTAVLLPFNACSAANEKLSLPFCYFRLLVSAILMNDP